MSSASSRADEQDECPAQRGSMRSSRRPPASSPCSTRSWRGRAGQVGLPRQHEPRASHPHERHPRLHRDDPRRHLRRGARGGSGSHPGRPDLRAAAPPAHQRRARSLSKIEAGRMELSLTDYSVEEVVETARPRCARSRGEGLEFTAEVEPDLPSPTATASASPVPDQPCGQRPQFTKQAAWPSRGAVTATRSSTVSRTRGSASPPTSSTRSSGVSDRSMPASARSSAVAGSGSHHQNFVELHGGHIWVESEPGRARPSTSPYPCARAEPSEVA